MLSEAEQDFRVIMGYKLPSLGYITKHVTKSEKGRSSASQAWCVRQ